MKNVHVQVASHWGSGYDFTYVDRSTVPPFSFPKLDPTNMLNKQSLQLWWFWFDAFRPFQLWTIIDDRTMVMLVPKVARTGWIWGKDPFAEPLLIWKDHCNIQYIPQKRFNWKWKQTAVRCACLQNVRRPCTDHHSAWRNAHVCATWLLPRTAIQANTHGHSFFHIPSVLVPCLSVIS